MTSKAKLFYYFSDWLPSYTYTHNVFSQVKHDTGSILLSNLDLSTNIHKRLGQHQGSD